MTGQTIAHYRVEQKLGEGGMGVVYKARDLKLNRAVAIKFLSPEIANEERRQRFQQEAQAASSLNHPHILTVYDVGTAEDGKQYLVTEFIDGSSLREWSRLEKPSVRQVVELAIGLADGLACAHQAGIVHRDVKPENILVSRQGYAKLVDFGLAKLVEAETGSDSETKARSPVLTRTGVVVGSLAYMSPEQLCGKPVDSRSDAFAFGTVLYELLAGERPFTGKTEVEQLQAVLTRSPRRLAELRPEVPPELSAVVEKALEKDPADRYQTMRDMVVDLKRSLRVKAPPAAAVSARTGRTPQVFAAVGCVLVFALALTTWLLYRSDLLWQNPLAHAQYSRLTDFEGAELDAAISRDGKLVAFLADRDGRFDVWVSQVGAGESVNLSKGRLGVPAPIRNVGFSADGAQVWMRGGLSIAGVMLLPTMGGASRRFLENAADLAWSPDGGRLVYQEFSSGDPIFIAAGDGSSPKQIFVAPGAHCHYPSWSPDGRWIYFVRGDFVEMDIWRFPSTGGEPERLTFHNADVRYLAFLDERTLVYTSPAEDGSGPWLYALDVERRVPHRVSSGLEQYRSIAASADGRRLVATVANSTTNLWSVPIGDRIADERAARRLLVPTVRALVPRFGPDYLLYLSSKGGADGLWKLQNGGATELRKGSDGPLGGAPAISPDGRTIAFSVRKQGRTGLYLMTADGTGVRPIAEPLDVRGGASWSPDGLSIVVGADDGKGPGLFRVPVDGAGALRLVNEPSLNPVWSPDGRLILYSRAPVARLHQVSAVGVDGSPYPLPKLRIAAQDLPHFQRLVESQFPGEGLEKLELKVRFEGERYRFLPSGTRIVVMQGVSTWQQFWLYDLETGAMRPLTDLARGFSMRSFDLSPDGKQIVFDRTRENSDIVLIERAVK